MAYRECSQTKQFSKNDKIFYGDGIMTLTKKYLKTIERRVNTLFNKVTVYNKMNCPLFLLNNPDEKMALSGINFLVYHWSYADESLLRITKKIE